MTDSTPYPTLRHFVPKQTKRNSQRHSKVDDAATQTPPNPTCREQAVWRAVLMQAITDAFSQSRKPYAQRCKREALVWLRGNSQDFRRVCEYAGYDPAYLHGKISNLLKLQHQTAARITRQESEHFSLPRQHISAPSEWHGFWPAATQKDDA